MPGRPLGTLLLKNGGGGVALGSPSERADGVRWHTQMPRLPTNKTSRVPTSPYAEGAQTDRHVRYGEASQDPGLLGKDPLFPRIGGYQPARAPLSLFPSRKNPAQPGLMNRINCVLKESGLFDREIGAGFAVGQQQAEPSRARLDVLRVAFAIYSDHATVYRPFLGLVQREYEAHVNMANAALDKAEMMQQYLTMGDDHRAAAIEDMKAKWRTKLKRAHDAVLESKGLYDESVLHAEQLGRQIRELEIKCKHLEDSNEELTNERESLTRECKKQKSEIEQHHKHKVAFDRIEIENMLVTEQNKAMQVKVADLKTDIDMTNIRYIKQTEEHKNFRKEIKHLRSQLKEWTEIKDSVSPRPEWRRLQECIPGVSMNVKHRTRQLSERMALDLRFLETRPYLAVFRSLDSLPEADSKDEMEIPAAKPQAEEEPSSEQGQQRSSIFTWGSMLRKCPCVGQGSAVPCFLRAERPVTVALINQGDLRRFMRDFWSECESSSIFHRQTVPEAISSFMRSYCNTERGARELGYSIMFALQDLAPRSCDAAHFYHAIMMDIDESSRFAISEVRTTMEAIAVNARKNANKFFREILDRFPWTTQIQSQLESILQPYIEMGQDLDSKKVLSSKDDSSFVEFALRFFISHRRRLIQRIFHGLTAATAQAFPAESELPASSLLEHIVKETFTLIHPRLTPDELNDVVQLALGAQVVEYINAHRSASESKQKATLIHTASKSKAQTGKGKSEQPGASGTKLIYPLAHKLFPLPGSEELDGEDLRVTYIMRNLLCVLPEEDAARLNRVLAKMENVFLVLEQPIRVVPNKMAAAAQPSETRPERPGTQGSVSADVLTVELEPAAPLGIS